MNKILVGTAAIAALSLSGLAAHASCADPRSAGPAAALMDLSGLHQELMANHFDSAAEGIVGTWVVVYTPQGATTASGAAFIQWHSDGTEWENINYPVLNGNICMGSWKSADQSHVSRNHYGWLYDNGSLAGYFHETETDVVAADGNSYEGTNETTLYFTGAAPVVLVGTAKAMKIAP
jgi:hypothetical protein